MKIFFTVVALLGIILAPTVYAEESSDPASRLQEIQQRRNIIIPAEQRSAAIQECISAKTNVVQVQREEDAAVHKRLAVYSAIQKEIKAIELRMSKQGADASEIDLLIGKLQQNLDAFTESARYSSQLADDINTIDCAVNPEYYKAAVIEYTESRENLFTLANDLKKTVIDAPQSTFKPLINRLRI